MKKSTFLLDEGIELNISLSIGEVTSTQYQEHNIENLMHIADKNMYLIKQQNHADLLEETDIHEILSSKGARLLLILKEKDIYSYMHSLYTAQYAVELAEELNLSLELVKDMQIAGLVHDLGKVTVPKTILSKPKELTVEEYEIVKFHVEDGLNILGGLALSETVLQAVKYHHERWDGTGYPYALPGSQQPLEARILQIADAFAAMTIKQVYSSRLTVEEALEIIQEEAGHQFDPDLAAHFIQMKTG